MAEYLFSKDVGIYLDVSLTTTPDWKLVTCTTSKALDIAVASIEKNNDCTGNFVDQLPSTVSWSMPIEGDANVNPAAGEVSAAELFDVAVSRAIKKWKFENGDSSYVRYGEGFLSAYNETLSTPDYLTFSATITGSGDILSAEPT